MSHHYQYLPRANSGRARQRRLIVALLAAAVLWLALIRATHVHSTDAGHRSDQAGQCDVCAQLAAPGGLASAQPVPAWVAAWIVIALLIGSRAVDTTRIHAYRARGPPRG